MNGHVIPNTPIAVDFWHVRKCPTSRVFFLTHMHSDHTVGLTSQWQYPIYCSPTSKRLLMLKYSIDSTLIRELQENESHVVSLDERGEEKMTVTVIDANHCPGAVMFLFDGYFGRILYSGDFRYEPWMSVDTPLVNVADINVLYLDNTYNCSACSFPSRSAATKMVCDVIRGHPEKDVVIGVNNLGKEDLLQCVAETFHRWIGVSPEFYKKCTVLQRRNVFITDVESTSIRAVPMHEVTRARLNSWNKKQPTIAILPTALYFAGGSVATPDMFVVPYSDHSSYSELVAFVEHVKPRLVIPIVRKMSNAENLNMTGITDVGNFSRYLDVSVTRSYKVPDSVTEWMKLARHNSVGRRKSRVLSKKTLRRRKKCNEVEFTDESPMKRKQISPTAELQQSRDRPYDDRDLICVEHVRSVNRSQPLEKRKLPLSSVIDGNVNVKRSKVEPSEEEFSPQQGPDKDETMSPCRKSLADTNTDVNSNIVEGEDNILPPGQKAPTENNNGVVSQCHISDVTGDIGECTMDRLHPQDSDHVSVNHVMEPESSHVCKPLHIAATKGDTFWQPPDVLLIRRVTKPSAHASYAAEPTEIPVDTRTAPVAEDFAYDDVEGLPRANFQGDNGVHPVKCAATASTGMSPDRHSARPANTLILSPWTLCSSPRMPTSECMQESSADSSTRGSPCVTSQLNVSQHAQMSGVSQVETLITKTSGDIFTEAQPTDTLGDTWARSQNSEMSDDVCAETQNIEMFFDARTESQDTEIFFDTLLDSQNTVTSSDNQIESQNTETSNDTRIESQNTETSNDTRIESQNTETSNDTRIESQNTETSNVTRIETQNTKTPSDTRIETQNTETSSDTRIETQNTETQTSETFIDTRTKAQQFMQDSQRTTFGVTNSCHRRHSSIASRGPATPTLLYPATPRLLCYRRHSSVADMGSASPTHLCSPNNGNASTPCSVTRNKHKLCETRGTDSVIGSSVYETDPDVIMRLIDPLLDKEARRMSSGHSWLTQT